MSPSKYPVVLITGASRGLGLSVAQLLLEGTSTLDKANVVTLSRSKTAELEALASRKTSSGDTRLIIQQGNVTSKQDNQSAVQAAIDTFGRLDAVVLNAGTIEVRRLADTPPESFAEQINTLLNGLINTLHYAIPHLRKSPTGCGKVVFVSSGAAVGNTAGWGSYNAGKAAMNSVARTLANEEDSLAVFSVRPGMVDTEMQATGIRTQSSRKVMKPDEYDRLHSAFTQGKLLKAHLPGHVLAALAVRATRQHPPQPDQKSDKGAGAMGSFVNWNADELKDFQYPAKDENQH